MIHFTLSEFDCPCCSANMMDNIVLEKLDKIRTNIGLILHVNSGYRCVKHNKEVGGESDSMHLRGKAVDISTANLTGAKKYELLKMVQSEFRGIGIGKNFIHMDIRDAPCVWVY